MLEIILFIEREGLSGVTHMQYKILASGSSSRIQGWYVRMVFKRVSRIEKSLVLSLYLSINMAQIASDRKNFHEISYSRLFENRRENSVFTKIW
jgi:hypothetical protein